MQDMPLSKKCPCEQCISFAICNAQINSMNIPDVTRHSIERNCEILMEYIKADTRHDNGPLVDKTRKLFGLRLLYGK